MQDRKVTREELNKWFEHSSDAGMALVLGPVSGVFVVDVDGPEAHAELVKCLGYEPIAPKVLSGSGKPDRYHLFFRHPAVSTKAKSTPWEEHLEFRGKGGIVILPPSVHKSGNRYTWAAGRSPKDIPLPEVPQAILEALKPVPLQVSAAVLGTTIAGVKASRSTARFLRGELAEGPRWNDGLFNAACDLHGRGMPLDEAIPLLIAGARPWNVGERDAVLRTIDSAYSQRRTPGRV